MTPSPTLERLATNAGLPELPAGAPARVIDARHPACGAEIRLRVPPVLPAHALRRLRCSGCGADFDVARVRDRGIETSAGRRSHRGGAALLMRARRPRGLSLWRWAGVPVGAVAVIAALLLIQGGGEDPRDGAIGAPLAGNAAQAAIAAANAESDEGGGEARLARGSHFAVAVPAGWSRAETADGPSFAAVAPGGEADATLWIERAPELDLEAFEARSLEQLESLAGGAVVIERVDGPRPEASLVRIAATAPDSEPRLEVTLRAAGPYRYYLATTIEPNASPEAVEAVQLVHGSFVPDPGGTG